jgi:hypothetical protein
MKVVNNEDLAVGDMKGELLERRALPIGRSQFDKWAERIIKGAAVEADRESLRFSLAAMLMQLAPTEAFREDAYFMLALRTAAVKQTAFSIAEEIKAKKQAEAQPSTNGTENCAVLGNKKV